jgi:aspartate/methionine/tyrosine aminotransferase
MQAFVNLVLTLCDAGDSVVMFAPYYFNAYMSFQMTGITDILVGPGDPKTLYPDAGKIKKLHDLLILLNSTTFDISGLPPNGCAASCMKLDIGNVQQLI